MATEITGYECNTCGEIHAAKSAAQACCPPQLCIYWECEYCKLQYPSQQVAQMHEDECPERNASIAMLMVIAGAMSQKPFCTAECKGL